MNLNKETDNTDDRFELGNFSRLYPPGGGRNDYDYIVGFTQRDTLKPSFKLGEYPSNMGQPVFVAACTDAATAKFYHTTTRILCVNFTAEMEKSVRDAEAGFKTVINVASRGKRGGERGGSSQNGRGRT